MIKTIIETWSTYPTHVRICLYLAVIFVVALTLYAIYDTWEELKDE